MPMIGDLAAFAAASVWAFLQVFTRVSALFVSAPVFGATQVPPQVKIGLAAVLSFVLLPLVKGTLAPGSNPPLGVMAAVLLGQTVIGLLLGFVVSLLFQAVRIGGDIIDYQMGFTQAATFNPQFNETASPVAEFQYRYALVLYLLLNGHWLLIAALLRSFALLPVGKLALTMGTLNVFTDVTFQMLIAGVQIAAPAAVTLLITDIGFALLNRALPQMQIYYVGMPVKVLVGLAVLIAMLPLVGQADALLIQGMPGDVSAILRGMHR